MKPASNEEENDAVRQQRSGEGPGLERRRGSGLLDFENAHDPVLRSEHLLDRLELEVLMADLSSQDAVVAWRLTCTRYEIQQYM